LPPKSGARINFLKRTRDRYKLTAIVPRDVPSSLAISASLNAPIEETKFGVFRM
jgi:hypothetical protein